MALDLNTWVGRKRAETDVVAPSQAMAMAATLDLDPDAFHAGAALPEFWHWIYFTPVVRRSRLGEDGHERRGDFLPPVELPRRMWAGGRLQFIKPVVIGTEIERNSEIISVTEKQGHTGRLVVVKLRHIISDTAGVCIEEEQDLVYCEIPKSNKVARRQDILPDDVQWSETVATDAIILFRYSALIFNAHRIHYDHNYTTQIEGYRGLVVHGPLTATLLIAAAKRNVQRQPASFHYRGVAPLFNEEPITLAGRSAVNETTVWAAGPAGTIAMQGVVGWRQ